MSLDEELRRAAESIRQVSVHVPDPGELVDRSQRRPGGRARPALAVAAALVVVGVAVGVAVMNSDGGQRVAVTEHRRTTSPTTTVVVPWRDRPTETAPTTSPTTIAPPATAPACTSADIDVTAGEPSGLPDGTGTRLFEFTNISPSACQLAGRPSVSAVLDDGTRVAATAGQPGAEIHGPDVATTVIPPGEASLAALGFPGDCPTTPFAAKAVVSFGDQPVEVSLPRPEADPDDTNPSGPGALGNAVPTSCGLQIGTFTVAMAPPPALALVGQLHYRIITPTTATAGSDLRVQLVARNPTNRSISFHPCPAYELQLSGAEHDTARDSRQLNCADAPTLAPGASVTFDLRLTVPATTSVGGAALTWMSADTDQLSLPNPIDVMPPCEATTSTVDRGYLGITLTQAQRRVADAPGRTLRVIWQDGTFNTSTADLAPGRIDIYVRHDVIEQACREVGPGGS